MARFALRVGYRRANDQQLAGRIGTLATYL